MRSIVLACLLFASALPPTSAAPPQTVRHSEPAYSETRQIGTFDTIAVHAPLELTISRSQQPSLQVSAPQAVLRTLTTTVAQGRLTIRLPDMTNTPPPIRVTVATPSLRAIEIAGAARVQATDLITDTLAVALTGSGVIALGGQVERLTVSLGGSGALDLARLQAQHATLDFTGSGEVRLYASQSVQAQLSGAGRIVISGNPKQRSVAQSGSGQIVFQ